MSSTWQRTRLKFLASVPMRNGVGEPGDEDNPDWPRYVRTTDIESPRRLRSDIFASLPPEIAQKAPLHAGDIVMSAAGSVGKATLYNGPEPACYAGYLVRFRAQQDVVDPQFIAYWTESQDYWDQVYANSVASTIENFSASRFQNLLITLPPLDEQLGIIAFLDKEIGHIDALIALKEKTRVLTEERDEQLLVQELGRYDVSFPTSVNDGREAESLPHGWKQMKLGRVLRQLTNGFVGPTRDILTDDGVRYVQSLHIKRGKIDFERRPYYVSHEWYEARPRIHLHASDVLIVQTGDIGQVAVVPPSFGQATCHALQIARVWEHLISGEYLAEYLRSPYGKQSLLSRATGALHPHLEAGIRDVNVLVPPLDIQGAIVRRADAARTKASRLRELLENQIRLLKTRRSSLISNAVLGTPYRQ